MVRGFLVGFFFLPQGVVTELTISWSLIFLFSFLWIDVTGRGPPKSLIKTVSIATLCYI